MYIFLFSEMDQLLEVKFNNHDNHPAASDKNFHQCELQSAGQKLTVGISACAGCSPHSRATHPKNPHPSSSSQKQIPYFLV